MVSTSWFAAVLLVAKAALAVDGESIVCETAELAKAQPGVQGLSVTMTTAEGKTIAALNKVLLACSDSERFEKLVEGGLLCHSMSSGPLSPDKPQTQLACSDPQVMDKGYEIYLTTPDFTGARQALVYERFYFGQVFRAELPCRQ